MLSYRRLPDRVAAVSSSQHSEQERWKPPQIPTVSDLSLTLRAFELSQRFFERRRLLRSLRKHYMSEVRRQLHKILLHTDVTSIVTERSAVARAGRGVFSKITGAGRLAVGTVSSAASKAVGGGVGTEASAPAADTSSSAGRTIEIQSLAAASGQLRLPRALIGVAREVRTYNEVDALCWHYLHHCLELVSQASGEPLIRCVRMAAKGEVLLLTDMRLACLAITQPLKVYGRWRFVI